MIKKRKLLKSVYCSASSCPRGKIKRTDAFIDDLGNVWCPACTHRGEFLNKGLFHHWPALECQPYYAIAEGQRYWQITAFLGTDDRVYTLLFAIDALESEGQIA